MAPKKTSFSVVAIGVFRVFTSLPRFARNENEYLKGPGHAILGNFV